MRKNVVSLFVLASMLLGACEPTADSSKNESKKVKGKTEVLAENKSSVKMEIEGMVCAMGCAKYIEDKVADLDGILTSKVNFEAGIATFEFDKTVLSAKGIQQFINEIHDGQYKATLIKKDEGTEEDSGELEEVVEDDGDVLELSAPVENAKKQENGAPISSVREKLNVSFPELLTYFLKQIK